MLIIWLILMQKGNIENHDLAGDSSILIAKASCAGRVAELLKEV